MVSKNFILALCCSIGAALPLTVMAQMPSQPPTGTSAPGAGDLSVPGTPGTGGGMSPASGGGMTPSAPGGGMTPSTPGGMSRPSLRRPSTTKPATSTTSKVSVNSATLKELVKVKGIGPATANKIITGRPYASLEELVTKKALTQKQLTQLEPQIGL
jgi:Helix-hairpin-helix motif